MEKVTRIASDRENLLLAFARVLEIPVWWSLPERRVLFEAADATRGCADPDQVLVVFRSFRSGRGLDQIAPRNADMSALIETPERGLIVTAREAVVLGAGRLIRIGDWWNMPEGRAVDMCPEADAVKWEIRSEIRALREARGLPRVSPKSRVYAALSDLATALEGAGSGDARDMTRRSAGYVRDVMGLMCEPPTFRQEPGTSYDNCVNELVVKFLEPVILSGTDRDRVRERTGAALQAIDLYRASMEGI